MVSKFPELEGLTVTVDRVLYVPHLRKSSVDAHPFVYYITIHNHSGHVVTVYGRKWVVTSENGEMVVVEGDGVVGKTPRLESGDAFSYNSSHSVMCNSVAEGSYLCVTEEQDRVVVRIPPFRMDLPVA